MYQNSTILEEGNTMKKTISILLCAVLATTLLAACAAAPGARNTVWAEEDSAVMGLMPEAPMAPPPPQMSEPMPAPEMLADDIDYAHFDDDSGFRLTSGAAGNDIAPINAPAPEGMAEKIIYSVFADIETMRFDESVERVYSLLARYGGFIENSSISGTNLASQFHGWSDYRYAYFALRVPKDRLDAITADLDSLGNVTNVRTSAENITSQFFDTQSRLNSLRIQEERLLDMLSKAEDVPDLIAINEQLGNVLYQIEFFTTMLNNMQSQVDFSYLTVSIMEVEQFTEPTQIHRTYWQQIGDGFLMTIRNVGRFFMDLFRWLIISAPVLVILAVIAIATIFIIRWKLRSNKKKKSMMSANTAPPNVSGYPPPEYTAPTNTHQHTPPENPDN